MELDIKGLLVAAAVIALVIFAAVKIMEPEKNAGGSNPSLTYTTTADKEYSSDARAGSAGKVLIFGRPTCSFTRKTLESLAASSRLSSANIDIAFIDIDNSPKSKIEAFEKQIKCKYITFCYGDAPHGEYIDMLPESEISGNMYQLPLTVYIDSGNKVTAVSSGPKTADEIYGKMGLSLK